MSRSLYTPNDDHDHHLRNLIDQRTTRADVHGRYPSVSEFSDTPSMYSRGHFSPTTSDSSSHYGAHVLSSRLPLASPHSRGNQQYDPQASMLDLEDDRRTSYASSGVYDHDNVEDDDRESVDRMSYLGPKMRFHSRAPWETEEGTLEEEEEELEDNHRHFPAGFPFSRAKSTTSRSSSPRPSYSSTRPSGESARSQLPPKRSFETINSQMSYPRGAL